MGRHKGQSNLSCPVCKPAIEALAVAQTKFVSILAKTDHGAVFDAAKKAVDEATATLKDVRRDHYKSV